MHFHWRLQQRKFRIGIRLLLGSVAIFAVSFLPGKKSSAVDFLGDSPAADHVASSPSSSSLSLSSSPSLRDRRRRLFGFFHGLFDPKTTAPRAENTVTVYITRESYQEYHQSLRGRNSNVIFNPALSVFKTDVLRRFGTGRIQYIIREYAECDPDCNPDRRRWRALQEEPCLVVSRHMFRHTNRQRIQCDVDKLKCNYPRCKTMVTNDEMCQAVDAPFDARLYYTSDRPDVGYLPLGPRLDAWQSLAEAARGKNPHFFVMPPSRRKFAFNAIFSQSTNRARRKLASLIERTGPTSRLPVYAHITYPREEEQHSRMGADDYVDVLLDSIFTLSPAGHNPECYRAYEAVEAGSIPVFLREDLLDARHPNPRDREELRDAGHPCRDAMGGWRDAPVLVLDSWDELYPAIEERAGDPVALDAAQGELAAWYDGRMRGAVSRFEDFVLGATSSPAGGAVAVDPLEDSINNDFSRRM